MNVPETLGLIIAGLVLLFVVIRIFFTPLKWILKLVINTGLGYGALFVLNWLGSHIGFTLGINLFNALVTAVFGVPGVILLCLLKWLAIT